MTATATRDPVRDEEHRKVFRSTLLDGGSQQAAEYVVPNALHSLQFHVRVTLIALAWFYRAPVTAALLQTAEILKDVVFSRKLWALRATFCPRYPL